jgi:ubiquinone/menaquinone biosynthesis C-methylase UbiE
VVDLTEDVLRRSGIQPGMRVLDLGCGAGDGSLSMAKLVGPSGLVVGVDASTEAIAVAEKRATAAGRCYWTRFVTADPNAFVLHERFDAVVVRHTLLRQGERATFLRLSACVRPDGVIMVVSGEPAAGQSKGLGVVMTGVSGVP